MKLSIETPSYNDRRYGKPWIALVDFSDPKGTFTFGYFVGSHGGEGLLEIDAPAGAIIARGQKDNRGQAYKSSPSYYQLLPEGTLSGELTKAQALKAWRDTQTAPTVNPLAGFSDDEITAEFTRRTR